MNKEIVTECQYKKLADEMLNAFSWRESKEGFEHWRCEYNKLLTLAGLEEETI